MLALQPVAIHSLLAALGFYGGCSFPLVPLPAPGAIHGYPGPSARIAIAASYLSFKKRSLFFLEILACSLDPTIVV